jgi:hypothetical protein
LVDVHVYKSLNASAPLKIREEVVSFVSDQKKI